MRLIELYNEILDEDYPLSFNMEKFKSLNSFNSRVQYCEQHLQRISSGSGRIVYKIDGEKVLKLAKNKKGVAQIEVEVNYGSDSYLKDILATIFDYHPNYLWIEMELARKLNYSKFKQITGFDFKDFSTAIHNHGVDNSSSKAGYKISIEPSLINFMWEDEFVHNIFDFIGSYDVGPGDLERISTYGIVTRYNEDTIVIIDYGITNEVYDSYYR